MQPKQVLQERGTPVYSCTCSCGSSEVQAVMKVGECEHEVRGYNALFIPPQPSIILPAAIDSQACDGAAQPRMPLHTGVSDPVSE